MSLDLDHVLIDPLCTTFSTPEEVDEVVGQRRVADLNAHFAAVPVREVAAARQPRWSHCQREVGGVNPPNE